jgi:hypothetical protein
MVKRFGSGMVAALGIGAVILVSPGGARAQVFERDTKITGPRGNSVERKIESVRTPGGLERDVTITRPNGTFQRDLRISRPPTIGGFGGGGFVPPPFRPGPWARPPVIINNGGGGLGGLADFGIGAALGTGAGMLLGSALSRPAVVAPPMVVAQPAPIVVAQPAPMVVAPGAVQPGGAMINQAPPVVYQHPPQVTVAYDPVLDAANRLKSNHSNSRRDGCVTLGRIGDPRAVPALVDRLKNDPVKDVRVAAAAALGEIGDPQGAVVLERATIYEKNSAVRDAAVAALARARMPREVITPTPASGPAPTPTNAPPTRTNHTPQFESIERVPPPPAPPTPEPGYRPSN